VNTFTSANILQKGGCDTYMNITGNNLGVAKLAPHRLVIVLSKDQTYYTRLRSQALINLACLFGTPNLFPAYLLIGFKHFCFKVVIVKAEKKNILAMSLVPNHTKSVFDDTVFSVLLCLCQCKSFQKVQCLHCRPWCCSVRWKP
jgi:hypothetical protein